MSPIDKLFQQNQVGQGEFVFDERVADVFDDMVSRSVPMYRDVQKLIPRIVRLLDHASIKVVDLGCSTGTSLAVLAKSLPDRQLELIGIDNSAAMLEKCRSKLSQHDVQNVQLIQSDIQDYSFNDVSVVLMNYTLQFVPTDQRVALLRKIHDSLRPGGLLILSEKLSHHDAGMDRELFELYFEYKRENGYSELEIARKRDALENVLVPLSVSDNRAQLQDAGFGDIEMLLKWFNFGTFLARA